MDRLFTRLSEEDKRRPDPVEHPDPAKLAAYRAKDLSPEEYNTGQEHLVRCNHCAGMILDLKRLLEPPLEDRPREGGADFETAAEWRELWAKVRKAQAQTPAAWRGGLFRRISGAPTVAAVLAILLVGAAYRIVVLQRELARPSAVQITTVEAQGSKKGTPGVAEATPFRLGK